MTQSADHKPGLSVSLGAAIAALSGFVILLLAARVLPARENAIFLSFWSALFLVTGVLSGIQQEVTRATAQAARAPMQATAPGFSPFKVTLGAGAIAALVVLLSTPLLSPAMNGGRTSLTPALLIGVAAVLYSGQMTLTGILGGRRLWNPFGIVTGGEALVRLGAVIAVAIATPAAFGFEVSSVAAFLTWLLIFTTPGARETLRARVAIAPALFAKKVASAMAAAGATAFLVNGFPFLMAATTSTEEYQASADLAVAVSVTRAPILVPIFAFQAVVVAHFVRHPDKRRESTRKLVVGLGIATVVLVPLAYVLGPLAMSIVFGPAYANTSLVLAALVADAVLLALLVLGGTITIALDDYRACLTGWYASATVAVILMALLPLPLLDRTILTLSCAPLLGIALHFKAIVKEPQRG